MCYVRIVCTHFLYILENDASIPPIVSGSVSGGDMTCSQPPSGVILFPPSTTTELPKFTAPIIVPTMNQTTEPGQTQICGTPTATNPMTNAPVNITSSSTDDLGIPNFDDDTQMFHYTLSKLKKTLLDVQHRLQVMQMLHSLP